MHLELLFKFSFVLLFVSAVAIRVRYQRVSGTYREGVARHAEGHLAHEAKLAFDHPPAAGTALVWRGPVLVLCPEWISWSFLRLPVWMRVGGLLLAGLGLLLLWRSHRALGKNFRPTLEAASRPGTGDRRALLGVRHPLYLAFLLMLASAGLLSSNWFIGVVGVLLIASITVVRIPAEEALLSHRFWRALP